MGCDGKDPCLQVGSNGEFGLDHLNKIEILANHASELGLPTTKLEAAAIVGAAYAASQIAGGQAGIPVKICLRSADDDQTEFRVLSTEGQPLIEWQSTANYRTP